jgi:DNA replication and repair protein RecF
LILRELRVRAWRNVAAAVLQPGPRATVLYGQNGQGKTNLVEAAHYLTTFRSFRTNHVEEVVPWGAARAQVEGDVSVGGLERKLAVSVGGGRKSALLDGKPVGRAASRLQGVAAVLFVPEDLLLPKASPGERRRFLDRAIFAGDRSYSSEAVAFEKILRSRNAVLREGAPRPALLDTYDEELARTGARVIQRRRAMAAALAPRVCALFAAIHSDLGAEIRYRGHESLVGAQSDEDLVAGLLAGLRERRGRDLQRGFTGFGPHTDDLDLVLGGHPARDHGSQGQLRSLVLALKLAELADLQERQGEPPLLLLDDVASELDEVRRGKLFETIAGLPGQTLITVTDRDLLPTLPERRDFEVAAGAVHAVG